MSVLSTQARDDLSKKQFALPGQEKYPIPDLAHARNALARVSQFGSPEERKTVRSKVYSRYPELKENFQEREGESPTSKENLVREKLSAYEQGYIDTFEKIGLSVQPIMKALAKQTPWGLFKAPLSPEAASKGLQFAETAMRARAPRAVSRFFRETGQTMQPVTTLNPAYVRGVRQQLKHIPGMTQDIEAMGGKFLGAR